MATRRSLDYYGLATEKKARYDVVWDEREEMIVVDLTN
jgi:hypothetical protein